MRRVIFFSKYFSFEYFLVIFSSTDYFEFTSDLYQSNIKYASNKNIFISYVIKVKIKFYLISNELHENYCSLFSNVVTFQPLVSSFNRYHSTL